MDGERCARVVRTGIDVALEALQQAAQSLSVPNEDHALDHRVHFAGAQRQRFGHYGHVGDVHNEIGALGAPE